MSKIKKELLKSVVSFGMAVIVMILPIFTHAEVVVQRPDDWATLDLYKAEVSGILPLDWQRTLHSVVTPVQVNYIIKGLEKKFEQAGLEKEGQVLAGVGKTREDVLNTYYKVLLQYENQLDLESNMLEYMTSNKIVAGDNEGNINADKPCTVQEATLFANRILEDVYDQIGAGSKGYVWEVTHQDNKVYLLGTVHVAQEDIYPFSSKLNSLLASADKVAFEVDLNDQRGMAYLIQKQMYMDGTTLKDHISLELYKETVDVMKQFGISEAETMKYKPWVLANTIVSLSANANDRKPDQAAITLPIIDSHVYTTSLIQDKDIIELEGYVFQANMFDSISLERQIESLEGSIVAVKEDKALTEEVNTSLDTVQYWVDAFVEGDVKGFMESYPKDKMLQEGDEMSKMLFIERDQHMTQKVIEYLNAEGDDTYFVVVGAAHMIGETGIVNQLTKLGYNVRVVK